MRLAVRPYTRLGATTQYDEGHVQLSHTAGSGLIFDGFRRSLLPSQYTGTARVHVIHEVFAAVVRITRGIVVDFTVEYRRA